MLNTLSFGFYFYSKIIIISPSLFSRSALQSSTNRTMDPYMSIGCAAYEALLPQDLPTEAVNTAMRFIKDTLTQYQQPKSYGIIIRHAPRLSQPTIPTILLGFPDITLIPTLTPPNPIAEMPVLIVTDKAVPMVSADNPPMRSDATVHAPQRVGLSRVSVGARYSLQQCGSFGGWLSTKDGRKLGLTCAHCLPGCDIGATIVCPSTAELTSRLDAIVEYTSYCPASRYEITYWGRELFEAEVEFLRGRFQQLSDDDNGVELKDGSKIKLMGPDFGKLVAKREHQSTILNRHNQRLQHEGKRGFALESSIPLSRLDWAVLECPESRSAVPRFPSVFAKNN